MKLRLRYEIASIWNDKKGFQRFRYAWEKAREQTIFPKPTLRYAEEKGLHIASPQEIFTPYKKEIVQNEEVIEPEQKPPCYMINQKFKPMLNVQQIQVLTNSVVYNSLPSIVVPKETGKEEEAQVESSILLAHLLDSKREILPRLERDLEFTFIYGPGFVRYRGIPMERRVMNFSKNLLSVIARWQKVSDLRRMVTTPVAHVELENEDLFHLELPQALLLTSSKPLPVLRNSEEVSEASKLELPDIYPLKPFIHRGIKRPTEYEDAPNTCGLIQGQFPHTVFAHDNSVFFDDDPTEYESFALLHGFATASAFARQHQGIKPGEDLKEPITVNVVYTNGRHLQFGVHQLNTLNLTGQKKNIFWTEPWSRLFWNVDYVETTPCVSEIDLSGYNVLKGLYSMSG